MAVSTYLDGPASKVLPQLGAHRVDLLVMLLLFAGFFVGPLKLLGDSWFGYLGADAIAVLVLILVFGGRAAAGKPLVVASPIAKPLLALAGLCVVELANPAAPFIRSVFGVRSWLLYLSFLFVGFYTLRSTKQVERLYALLLTLGVLTGLYGVYQWQAGPQLFAGWSEYYGRYAQFMWSWQSNGAVFRAFSTYVLPNTFGANMALLMILAFSVAASPRIRLGWRISSALAFAIMGAGIAASGSRGPVALLLLAGLIGFGFIPSIRGRFKAVFVAVLSGGLATMVIALLIGPVVGERFASIFDPEVFLWKWLGPLTYGLRIAAVHPFGMGLGYTAGVPRFISDPVFQEFPRTSIDSGYGSAAAELGFLGLFIFIWFALTVGVVGVRTWKRLPEGRMKDLLLGPALFAGTYPAISVLFQPQAALPGAIYFWLLIGILLKAPTLEGAPDADHRLDPKTRTVC